MVAPPPPPVRRAAGPPPPPPPPPAPATAAPATAQHQPAAGASFRLFGIPVRLNLSFLLVGAVFMYAPGRSVSLMLMVVGIIAGSVLWHEIGHAVAFKAYGYEPEIVLMGPMGLTYSRTERQPSERETLFITAAGPAAGFLLAGVALALRDTFFADAYRHPLDLVVLINVVFNVFNLLPAYPLDGGRIVKAVMQMLSPAHGEKASQVVSLAAAGLGVIYSVNHDMQFTALILLGIAAINFGGLREHVAARVGRP